MRDGVREFHGRGARSLAQYRQFTDVLAGIVAADLAFAAVRGRLDDPYGTVHDDDQVVPELPLADERLTVVERPLL